MVFLPSPLSQNDKAEGHCVTIRRSTVSHAEYFGDAENETACHGAFHIAETAHDEHRQPFQPH